TCRVRIDGKEKGTAMRKDDERHVDLQRQSTGRYRVSNTRGGSISIGSGEDADFTPVELLLAAIGGCSAIDVDFITSKRSEPDEFTVRASGNKIRDESGNRMDDLTLDFTVRFPSDEGGKKAQDVLPKAVQRSHDRLCTVSRTVEQESPVAVHIHDQ